MNVNDMPCIHKHILSIFALKPMFKTLNPQSYYFQRIQTLEDE